MKVENSEWIEMYKSDIKDLEHLKSVEIDQLYVYLNNRCINNIISDELLFEFKERIIEELSNIIKKFDEKIKKGV